MMRSGDIFTHIGDFRRLNHSNAGLNIDTSPGQMATGGSRRNRAACCRVARRTSSNRTGPRAVLGELTEQRDDELLSLAEFYGQGKVLAFGVAAEHESGIARVTSDLPELHMRS
jgi:hypothetical protein